MPHEPSHASATAGIADARWRLRWVLLPGVVLIAILLVVQFWRYRPPPARGLEAPATTFSAARAVAALRVALGDDESPHPTGSPANHRVRDRIVATLRSLGYAPEIQTGHACDEWGDCASVENIVARLDGQVAGPLVALSAHYDSVGAGPGAADDGIGIATILEIARLLRTAPSPPVRPVLLLITDGEETGLLGARVFVERHPWAAQVGTVINLEARGNRGPSFMFETGTRNAAAMSLYPADMSRPITNSIYYTAYKLLPNDTDFTVFKAAGWQGYNFALTGNVQHYHTPLDRIANLSRDSLQHHGDNARKLLAALTGSAGAGPEAGIDDEAVYVDVLAKWLLVWPVSMALPLAVGSVLLAAAMFAAFLRRRALRLPELLQAAGLAMVAMLLAALACWMALTLLRALAAIPPATARYRWSADAQPLDVAAAALSLLALFLVAAVLRGRISLIAWWAATALLMALATLASAALLPGLGFAVQLPLLVLLLPAIPAALSTRMDAGRWISLALLLAAATTVLVLVPTLAFLHPSLGPDSLVIAAALLVWVFLPMAGLLADAGPRWLGGLPLAGAVIATTAIAIAAGEPPYTASSPQRMNIEYLQDADRRIAEWLLSPDSGRLPPTLASMSRYSRWQGGALPWFRTPIWHADATRIDLPAPELRLAEVVVEGAARRYRMQLRSMRGANSISLCWPRALVLTEIEVAGQRLPEPDAETLDRIRDRHGDWRCLGEHTLPAQGVELSFRTAADSRLELLLADRSYGVPESGRALQRARRDGHAVPTQDGDVTRVLRRFRIEP